MDNEKIILKTDDGTDVEFYVLEETKINGMNYILVTDSEEDDGECYILKDLSKQDSEDAIYEFVENDSEIEYLFKIFSELLSDADVDLEK